ncbi:MAG: aldose 1-epimerase family protein [Planctomycetota bacterium]
MVGKNKYPWQGKVCNNLQVGGIETSVIDNGLGKGNRIAWVNTGSGLRFKVVIDRCMDIADAFYNECSLSWISHGGVRRARPDANEGLEWLWSFMGGFLATCGLTHIGVPEKDKNEKRGLHGRIGNTPAEIESILQPDVVNGKLDMSITGVVKQSKVFGPNMELRRIISCKIGQPVVYIKDVVTNRGNTTTPHMILYHCNFGWPLVDEGAMNVWDGSCEPVFDQSPVLFNEKRNYKKCLKPIESGKGNDGCGVIDVLPDRTGICTVGVNNPRLGMALMMRYKKKQLPWLTNWQHWGYGEYTNALEPGTHPPTGQSKAKEDKTIINLRPGQSRTYELEFVILTDKKDISKFVKSAG